MLQSELDDIIEKNDKWLRDEEGGVRANLSGADLFGLKLANVELACLDISKANLAWANLVEANLAWTNLSGANLSGANLSWANLSWADLSGADLSRADLSEANLYMANLSGVTGVPGEIKGLRKLIADTVLANPAALDMNTWHTCDTAHCIAGWACHLAPNGRWIEGQLGTASAARFLLGLLGKGEDDVFYKSDTEALEVLKEWAKEER